MVEIPRELEVINEMLKVDENLMFIIPKKFSEETITFKARTSGLFKIKTKSINEFDEAIKENEITISVIEKNNNDKLEFIYF